MKIGDRIGKLCIVEKVAGPGKSKYKCACDCGAFKVIREDHLKAKATISCGCVRAKTAGKYKTPTYRTWAAMLQRCTNKNAPKYDDYGGRGIKVCDRWLESFENFLTDMGERPDGMTIDRENVDGNYESENCRWATAKQQARNRRSNRIVLIGGVSMTLSEAAEVSGVKLTTLKYRLDKEVKCA